MPMSFIQVPPDSSGKRLSTQTHQQDGVEVHTQHFHLVSPTDHANGQEVDNRGAAYVRFTEGMPIFDSFNKMKVVQTRIVGVYEHSQDSYDDLFSVQTANGGTSTYVKERSIVVLATTADNGSRVCRTTNRYHYYQPGNAVAILMTTVCGDTGKVNVIRRWGLFDDENGVFFELNGTTKNVVLRSNVSGVVTEIRVPQSQFNGDKLDGTGPSEMTIDATKMNLFWIDLAWLGAGTVRMGVFGPQGDRIVCHTFQNPNANSDVYMRTASLPYRTEILNIGPAVSGSELHEGCCTIRSDGDLDYSFWRFADMGNPEKTVTTDTPLFAIRSKTTLDSGLVNHINAYPETLSVYATQPTKIQIFWTENLTNATWAVPGASTLECDIAATAWDVMTWAITFFVPAGVTNLDLRSYFELNDEGILLAFDGTQPICVVAATALTAQETKVTAIMTYRELY